MPTIPVVKFDTHQVGQGVVYNVIVYDPDNQMEAAYSPAVTYAANYLKRKLLLMLTILYWLVLLTVLSYIIVVTKKRQRTYF